MRIGERYIVNTLVGTRHPKGTEVEVMWINKHKDDPTPILCRARGGKTEYWYRKTELVKEVDGIRIK